MLKKIFLFKNIKILVTSFYPKTLDRYLLAQAVPTFLIALGVILAALMLERLLVLLDLLTADSSPLSTFLGLLADLVPHYLGLAIPAALCVAVFSSMRQMSLNNEIDALLASGISLFRCARPHIICGCGIGFLCIILYGYIQPYARYDFRAAFFYASHSGWVPHIQSHMVVQPSDDLVMIVNKANKHGTHLSGVFIKQTTYNTRHEPIEHIILANTGNFYISADRSKVELNLFDGQNLTLNANDNNNLTNFNNATRLLARNSKGSTFRVRGDDEKELTITELYQQIRHHTNTIPLADITAEFHFRLVRALSILSIPILATGLAIMKKRTKRNWGLAIAAIALISYDHVQQLGSDLVSRGHHSALVALWLPLFIFFIICYLLLLFRNGFYAFLPVSLPKQNHKKLDK